MLFFRRCFFRLEWGDGGGSSLGLELRTSAGPLAGCCMLAGRAAASLHWSALETEQERWCSPSGRKPGQAEVLRGRSECRDVLLAE